MVHLGAFLLGCAVGLFLLLVYARVRARVRLEATHLERAHALEGAVATRIATELRRAERVQNARRSGRLAR